MSRDKLTNLWRMLSPSDVCSDTESSEEMSCLLCHCVLVDARQTPCGCRFCRKCLEIHLSSGSSRCPGTADDCQDVLLELEKNVSIDYIANRKLLSLKIKCPTQACQFVDTLLNMSVHLDLCSKPSIPCPFSTAGCEKTFVLKDQLMNHLQVKTHRHSHQLMTVVTNLTNDLEEMRKENKELKEVSKLQAVSLEELRKCISDIMETLTARDKERDLNKYVEESEGDLSIYRTKQLVWTIDDFLSLCRSYSYIDIEPFFTHVEGYKIQLRMTFTQWTRPRVSLYPNCIPGPHDSSLPWPFKCFFEIGFVDPNTDMYIAKDARIFTYTCSVNSQVEGFHFPNQVVKSFKADRVTVRCTWRVLK